MSNLRAVAYGNGKFVAVGSGQVLTSVDGISWSSKIQSGTFADYYTGVTYGNGMFIAMSSGGLATSADGISWLPRNTLNVARAVYGGDSFVAVGAQGIVQSEEIGARILVTPSSLDFQTATPGTTSSQAISISNNGSLNLVVSNIGISGDVSAAFSLAPGSCGNLTPTLVPGASCTIMVKFTPTQSGSVSASLVVKSNDVKNQSLNLDALGVGSKLKITYSSMGDGAGSVNSVPSLFSCDNPACDEDFDYGTTFTLYATSDLNSTFDKWVGACVQSGNGCKVTIKSNVGVSAVFLMAPNVIKKSDNSSYKMLQNAIDSISVGNNDVIRARAIDFVENVTINKKSSVINIVGGYDTKFASEIGYSKIRGKLIINKGLAILDKIVIY
jgi:hypothetical protein